MAVNTAAPRPMPGAPSPRDQRHAAAQDEWGLFDPEQCGFAALLAKLDEVTADGDDDQTAQTTSVRVISCS
jgi:hypothetical protein